LKEGLQIFKIFTQLSPKLTLLLMNTPQKRVAARTAEKDVQNSSTIPAHLLPRYWPTRGDRVTK